VPGLSSEPGTVDVTHALFNPWNDDGLANPIEIPSLRGAAGRRSYGHEARFASLRDFIRHVMMDEFAADEPSPWLLDALVASVAQLMPTTEADAPVTLAGDLADIDRFFDVLEAAAAERDADKTGFIAGALRFQLGRLHQRFAPPGGEAAQAVLVGWSRALAAARSPQDVAALRRRIAAERGLLAAAERNSLYEVDVLRRALGG
jgi:hypothetical protein